MVDETTPPLDSVADEQAGAASESAEQPRSGGLGGLINAILRGLAPVRRARRRRPGSRRSSGATRTSSGSRGPLLQLRYRDGGLDSWQTVGVAYGKRGNRIAVISSGDAEWWHHVRDRTPVQVRIRNAWVEGHARVLSRSDDAYARAVGVFIEDRSRAAAERLGIPMDSAGRLDHGPRRSGDAVVIWIEVDGA